MRTALIDADVVMYQASYAFQRKDQDIGPWESVSTYIDNLMEAVLDRSESQSHRLFITGKGNFRNDIAVRQEYKGNRKDKEKPFHLENVRLYLINRYEAEVIQGMEADDALAIEQTAAEEGNTVICSIDKDLLQVPGLHYNWRKDELSEVDEYGGMYNLYTQCLTGDRVDNIPGIMGIGPKKAEDILEGSEDIIDMHNRVSEVYKDVFGKEWQEPFEETMKLLWLVREVDVDKRPIMWEPPIDLSPENELRSPDES